MLDGTKRDAFSRRFPFKDRETDTTEATVSRNYILLINFVTSFVFYSTYRLQANMVQREARYRLVPGSKLRGGFFQRKGSGKPVTGFFHKSLVDDFSKW